AETLAWRGADQRLLLAVVADRLTRGIDATCKRRFGHDAAVPDGSEHVIFADDTMAVLDQMDQQVEDLGDKMAERGPPPQFAPVDVEDVVAKYEAQNPVSERYNPRIFKKL